MIRSTIFAPVAWWERHWAYAIEVAHREFDLGREVVFFQCLGALATCAANPDHFRWKCDQCVHQSTVSIREHFPPGIKVLQIQKQRLEMHKEKFNLPLISDMDALREFRYKNFPFGRHVLSHLISLKRDRFIPDHIVQSLGMHFLQNSIETFEEILELVPDGSEYVYIWGGRRSSEAPMKFAAQLWNSKLYFFEEGSALDKINITENDPISFNQFSKDIVSWEAARKSNSEVDIMLESGRRYFYERKLGTSKEPNFRWFLRNSIPAEIQTTDNRPLLCIFTSSDWEFAEYDSFDNSGTEQEFDNQYRTLAQILMDTDILLKFTVIVRWHPNHKIAGEFERYEIEKLISSSPHITHYKYDDPVNSYDLVQKSSVVVVFGSTIGVESASVGIPTILLGEAIYSGLGIVYEPKDYTSFKILLQDHLEALPTYWSLVWGDWFYNRGIRLEFLKMNKSKFLISGKRISRIKYSVKLRHILSRLLILVRIKIL